MSIISTRPRCTNRMDISYWVTEWCRGKIEVKGRVTSYLGQVVSGASPFGSLELNRVLTCEERPWKCSELFHLCLSLSGTTGYSWDSVQPRRHARQIDLRVISGSWLHDRWLARCIATIIWNRRRRPWNEVGGTAGRCQSIGYGIRTCGRSSPRILS